ncbi:MAG TPA: S41 family peptidase [Anaerolineales bacterium]|nr:S41 family peptidase [Anaerolineales bacterium]
MNRKFDFLPWLILMLSFALSACIGLIPLEEEPVSREFGPQTTPQEQQTRTFEALWKNIEENYIYYETAGVDWDALHSEYSGRIEAGLTPEEFTALLDELETELPEGSLLYESRAERIERETANTATYEGIGAFVGFNPEPEPHMVLLDVIEGSPAERAGLDAHDSIFEIDGSPVLLEEGMTAVERIRGPAGTSVTLGIQSPGTSKRSVEVKRGKLTSTGELEARNIANTDYGYLLFPPIGYETLEEEVLQNLETFTTNRTLEGLILDLRIAGSSRGWPLEVLYTFFHNGELGQFYNRTDEQVVQVEGQDVSGSQEIPLVVLVGQNTTGLPEILAAALQHQERAIVIGETTPGAIETTTSYYLPDGSQAFIQSTSFVLPNGEEIGETGVIPDIPLDVGWDEIQPDQDPVLDRAIEYLDEQP